MLLIYSLNLIILIAKFTDHRFYYLFSLALIHKDSIPSLPIYDNWIRNNCKLFLHSSINWISTINLSNLFYGLLQHGAVTNYMIYRKWNLVETSEYGFNILKNCLNNLFEFHWFYNSYNISVENITVEKLYNEN